MHIYINIYIYIYDVLRIRCMWCIWTELTSRIYSTQRKLWRNKPFKFCLTLELSSAKSLNLR